MQRSAAIHLVAQNSARMTARTIFLSGTAWLAAASAAAAQDVPPQPAPTDSQQAEQPAPPDDEAFPDDEGDGQTVVVTGTRQRGSVIGDIPPENTLTSRDVQATGATDINQLLEAIAPQIGSAQGRGGERPVLLLNGQRISSFRELRDIPTEAISRVEILPEEVALKYGYSANQRVVNFVLRPRFRSTAALASAKAATDGGYAGAAADVTRLMIGENGRTSVNLHAEGNSLLTESERDILLQQPLDPGARDPRTARSLIASKRDLRGSITANREIGTVGATGNIELEHNEGRSLIGLGDVLLEPLARNTVSDTAHGGFVFSGAVSRWNWSVTGNADAAHTLTRTDRDSDDPRDRAETTTLSSDVDAVANGRFLRLPAGDASATFRLGASTIHQDSDRRRAGVLSSNSLGRTIGDASASVDLPVSRRNSDFGALGNLTFNANAKVEQLSDFGTLTTVGAGASWSPVVRLNFIGSWTLEEGAPTVQQLGDPILETPQTRIFDFTTGETVLADVITGGNPALDADRRHVLKLSSNWQPFSKTDLRLRAEYVHSTIDSPISNFPGPTAALEAAFPDRFVRDADGKLVRVDLRPVNFDNSRRDTLRLGFDFSKPLKSAPPSPAAVAAFRQRAAGAGSPIPQQPGTGQGGRGGASGQSGGGGGRGGGFGRFGGGNRNGGRLTFSLTDTITLVDQVTIRDGLKLDYLHGDAFGQSGGRPRHQVEGRAGYFNNGLGAFVSANYRSGTEVTTATGDDLRFSPLATFDVRLFANLGQRFDLVAKHPWLRGSSLRLEVNNVFNSKPKVRDAFGRVPTNFQPDLLDPLGRTVTVTFRKLFLPPPSFFRSERSSGRGSDD
jgi:hypothetical protein